MSAALDKIIAGTNTSYYGSNGAACHLDLIPYATSKKWSVLSSKQRGLLIEATGDTLGLLLRDSPIRALVLNGSTVVRSLEKVAEISLDRREVSSWTLPRKSGAGVHITGDQPLARIYFWSIRSVACPEPYIHLRVEPGQQIKWQIAYEFYTLPGS